MTALPTVPEGRIGRLLFGFGLPFRGLRWLVTHPELWPWAALPMLLTVWSILGAGYLAWYGADDLLAWWWPRPHNAAVIGWELVHALMVVTSFVVGTLTLWVLGHLVAGPFYDRMAELVEIRVGARDEQPFALDVALRDAGWSFVHSVLGLTLYLLVMGPLFLLNLVPGAGSVLYTVLAAIATASFLARDLMDVPLSRRRMGFVGKLRYLRDHRWVLWGLGGATALLLAVPLLDLFVLPCAVLGGTLAFLAAEKTAAAAPAVGEVAGDSPPAG